MPPETDKKRVQAGVTVIIVNPKIFLVRPIRLSLRLCSFGFGQLDIRILMGIYKSAWIDPRLANYRVTSHAAFFKVKKNRLQRHLRYTFSDLEGIAGERK